MDDLGREGEETGLVLALVSDLMGELRWPRVYVDEAFSLPPCSCDETR